MNGSTDAPRGVYERAVMAVLDGMPVGDITITTPDGRALHAGGHAPGAHARISMRRPSGWRRMILRGGNGFADGYIEGDWDTADLDAVLAWGAQNVSARPDSIPTLLKPFSYLAHRLRDNSIVGSRRNIQYHYDLGNDFYELWLDDTMTYSAALFDEDCCETQELTDAQRAKWDRLLDVLQPDSKDHVLEVGCGWGGFAVHAATEAGCKVTGITLSQEQHDWAVRTVEQAGLEGKVDIRMQDYRHVPERFDAIASIEMFEAVGERWWPTFFRSLNDRLAPGGTAAIQVITLDEPHWEGYRTRPEFTQEHIFPGGMLPTPTRFAEEASDAGLYVGEPHFFGLSYAQTLARWREAFEAVLPDVRQQGFDDRFIRMWRYYLAYCRSAFEAGNIDVMQVGLSR